MIDYIRTSFKKGKYKILFLVLLLIIGILLGILYYNWQNEGMKEVLIKTINLNEIGKLRINNFFQHLFLFPTFILLLFVVIGFPISLFYLFYEGFSFGFTASIIIVAWKLKGVWFVAKYLLFFKLLYIPFLILFNLKMLDCLRNIIGLYIYRKEERIKRNLIVNFRKMIVYLIIILIIDIGVYFLSPTIFRMVFL